MINVGTIPEDFSFTDVYTFHVDELPALLVARRASADELIWDADGGFTDQWRDRSAVEGNEDDGFDFHIARRAFSVAGLPIFAAYGTGGGGSVGDATSIQGTDVSDTPPDDGQILSYDGDTDSIIWIDNAGGGGTGDVVGPASATNNNLTAFDTGTGKLIKDSGISTASVTAVVAKSALNGWTRVADINYTQLAPQTLVNGANTVAGITHTLGNIASAADYARVDSTGMTIKCNTVNGGNYFLHASTTPFVKIRLLDLAPKFVLGQSQLRMWCQMGSNGNADHESNGFGLTKRPWNGGVGLNWYYIWAAGSYDSISPHNGIIIGRGTTVAGRVDRNFTSVTPANSPATSVWGVYFKDFDNIDFSTLTVANPDTDANDLVATFENLVLRSQMRGASSPVVSSDTEYGNERAVALSDQNALFGTTNASGIDLCIMAMSTYNGTAHHIATTKRLVIEVKY